MNGNTVKRGCIFMASIPQIKDSNVQGGIRPVIVISNDVCNFVSPTITVVLVTSKIKKLKQPTDLYLGMNYGLNQESVVLCEQILTIDKSNLENHIGLCPTAVLQKILDAVDIQLGKPKTLFPVEIKLKSREVIDVNLMKKFLYNMSQKTNNGMIVYEFKKFCESNNIF